MAEPGRRSALHGHLPVGRHGAERAGEPGIWLQERLPGALAQIHGGPEPKTLRARLAGWSLESDPSDGRACRGRDMVLLWNGPGMWLVHAEGSGASGPGGSEPEGKGVRPGGLVPRLAKALLGSDATVTDLGHARSVLGISGVRCRELLAKGCPMDVERMAVDECAATQLGPFSVLLHCVAPEAFNVYVFRSFGLALLEWAWMRRRSSATR